MNEHLTKPQPFLGGNRKVEFDFSNYGTKADLKNATHLDMSKFGKKVDSASLKWEIDKLDINKLQITAVGLTKLSGVVKNEFLKKTEYKESVKKTFAKKLKFK